MRDPECLMIYPLQNLDAARVAHLDRWEVETLTDEFRQELAVEVEMQRNWLGAINMACKTLPHKSNNFQKSPHGKV